MGMVDPDTRRRLAPDVVVVLDCRPASGHWVSTPVAVTSTMADALGVAATLVRAWNASRDRALRAELPLEPAEIIAEYERLTGRRIRYSSVSYFASMQTAQALMPGTSSDEAEGFANAPGDTLDGIDVDDYLKNPHPESETVDTDA